MHVLHVCGFVGQLAQFGEQGPWQTPPLHELQLAGQGKQDVPSYR